LFQNTISSLFKNEFERKMPFFNAINHREMKILVSFIKTINTRARAESNEKAAAFSAISIQKTLSLLLKVHKHDTPRRRKVSFDVFKQPGLLLKQEL
jgi:hypothetical protein